MNIPALIWTLLAVSLVPLAMIVWFLAREIRKSRNFFRILASHLNGKTTRFPFGLVFELESIPVRIYALQGSIQYRAKVDLRTDPGILVTRTFRKLKFLDPLHYSPSRERYLFHSPADKQFGFRAKDTSWMREIFNSDLLNDMTETGRVTRIEIRRRVVKGAHLMINQSQDELEKAGHSIDILNQVVMQVSRSTLAL
jgi:hypothetical protein